MCIAVVAIMEPHCSLLFDTILEQLRKMAHTLFGLISFRISLHTHMWMRGTQMEEWSWGNSGQFSRALEVGGRRKTQTQAGWSRCRKVSGLLCVEDKKPKRPDWDGLDVSKGGTVILVDGCWGWNHQAGNTPSHRDTHQRTLSYLDMHTQLQAYAL